MRIHAFETGRLVGNETFMRGDGLGALLHRRRSFEFPAYCFLLEHPEGLLAIDAGMRAGVRGQRIARRFVPTARTDREQEVGPRMRAAGISPEEVRRVVVTHLDWDHVGGLPHFRGADIHLHRPEHRFAMTARGRMRYRTTTWPDWFSPHLYDFDPVPYGPFPASRRLTDAGDVVAVPLTGHSIGHVGVIVELGDARLLFAGDHVLRQDWLLEDLAAGRLVGLGQFFPDQARESTRRLARFLDEFRTVLLPSHDDGVPARLAALQEGSVPVCRAA